MPDSLHIAIVVNADLPIGFLANTVGAIAIGLGARMPQLAGTRLSDGQGRTFDVSANQPVPILQADAPTLRSLTLKAIDAHDLAVVPFPAFARSLNAFADYEKTLALRDLGTEEIDGLGLVGPIKRVRSLTGSLRLLR